ncbi:MAG TPA: helix-turn-helix transcriptional regulator [Polyangiales bacterium]
MKLLDKLSGEPLTFGGMLRNIRECDELTLEAFARKIGISRSNLCDIEQGRKGVSLDRAAKWARTLGYLEAQFVQLALQAEIDAAKLKYSVEVKAA